MSRGKCVILCAPSGSGKTTLAKHLLDQNEMNLIFSISATTRKIRKGEENGKDYFYLTNEKFIEKMQLSLAQISQTEDFKALVTQTLSQGNSAQGLHSTVLKLVDERLDELTPKMVKEIIQTMIREHLGWLVVWGGVFGGIFGLIAGVL